MEEQVLFNQIKSLIEEKIHELKAENDKLKKDIQKIKETLAKLCKLYKVDSEYPSESGIDDKKQSDNYKLIDLGLPSGTLWMDRNVGATSPTDYGLYFAWGETQGYSGDEIGTKKKFSWTDYKYCNGVSNKLTKYCDDSEYGNDGYTDSLVTLQTTDDTVLQSIHKCQMPTKEQIMELRDNTTYEWTTMGGVKGGLFTSKTNGNSIFVPAAGGCVGGSVLYDSVYGGLWSSSLYEDGPNFAWYLYFFNGEVDCGDNFRYYGFSVRGVVQTV